MSDPRAPDHSLPDQTEPGPAHGLGPAPRERRPVIERIGLALIAVVVMAIFGAIAAASFASGEPFLALMAALGVVMTAWAAGLTVLRG